MLVFPWARPSFDAFYHRRKLIKRYFESLGASKVDFCEYPYRDLLWQEQVASADLLYFTGGQVSVLLTRLAASGMDRGLKDFDGVIVGRSAGAMVFGQQCLVTRRYSKNPAVVKGLGLVDFSVKAHYTPTKDAQLRALSMGQRIYGIPERSALTYNCGALKVFGDMYVFEDGKKTVFRS